MPRCGWSLIWLLFALPSHGAASSPLKICLLSASAEYDSDKSLAEFQTYLEKHHQVICSRAFGKDKADDLPGLEALDERDLMVVFTRRVKLPADQLARIRKTKRDPKLFQRVPLGEKR